MKTTVSVVIPIFNGWMLTHQALFDLYNHCRNVNEVVIVNDASDELETFSGLGWWKNSKMLPIREIRLKENKGFLLSANLGMRKATGDVIVLLSNDVRLYYDVVQDILVQLSNRDLKTLVGGRLLSHDTGWNKFGDKIYKYLEGWLLATTQHGWEELGYFDERFAPNDYEDVDLSTTAIDNGYVLVELANPKIAHIGAQSIGYSAEREVRTNKNRKLFEEKWTTRR